MTSLNPGQFKGPLFHGTTFDVQGKDIVPVNSDAHPNPGNSVWQAHGHSGQKSSNHAFASESEDTAWEYADQAGKQKRAAHVLGESQVVPGRATVHTVAPHPSMQKGVYHSDHPDFNGGDDLKEWKSPAFRVTGRIDTKPGHQGTFASLNWNQFRRQGSGYFEDMNHPDDHEVEHGHTDYTGARMAKAGWQENVISHTEPHGTPTVDDTQLDLFSGDTVRDHAEFDETPVGDYHRNNLFGRI